MRSARPILVAACLLGAGLAGPGCQAGEPGSCGRAVAGGEFRFCSNDSADPQTCICATGRCARSADNCDFGLRYVYGDEECVPTDDVMRGGFVLSGDLGAACFETPVANTPNQLAPEPRVDPRLIRFGDRVLLEAVDPYTPPGTATHVYLQMLDWDGNQEAPKLTVDIDDGLGFHAVLRGAHSWGTCDHGDTGPQSALFAHWIERPTWRPLLLQVSRQGEGLRLDDRTSDTLGLTGSALVEALYVVGASNGCWVVWIEDPDGSALDGVPKAVRALRMNPDGTLTGRVDLFAEEPPMLFQAAALLLGEADDRIGLMAANDGEGGLVVAAPVRDDDAGLTALWARRVTSGGAPAGVRQVEVARFERGDSPCDSGPCVGIEQPGQHGVAAQAEYLYFGYVVVGPRPDSERTPFVSRMLRTSDGPSPPERIGAVPPSVRGVTLLPRPDGGVFGALMVWDGSATPAAGRLHLFQADLERIITRELPPPRALLPRLAVDDGGFLLASFPTVEGSGGFDLRLLRSQSSLDPAPTWPGDGISYRPPGSSLGGELSSGTATPLPRPDGGALTAWTTQDLDVQIARIQAVL